jgi:polysaccharide export outer membrane protein
MKWHNNRHTGAKPIKMNDNNQLTIFVVDDDPFCRSLYAQHLQNLGYTNVQDLPSGTDCLNRLTDMPDIVFLDHGMDVMNGLEVLKKIKRFNPDIYVVFVSGQEAIETAVSSLKYGAFDYIVKGSNDLEHITVVLQKIQTVKELLRKRGRNFLKKFLPFL